MQVRYAARQARRDSKRSWSGSRAVDKVLLAVFGGALLVLAPIGCAVTTPNSKMHTETAVPVDQTSAARNALEKMLRAYESGESLDTFTSQTMAGYQSLQNNIRDTQNQQKQIRVLLKDVRLSAGGDMVLIHANWEKRYLNLPGLSPQLVSGQATFSMSRGANGWRLAGIKGDNIFAATAK